MNNKYLPEDQDLLDELKKIGPVSAGIELSEQERKISEIQIKSNLRSRKTADDFSKSTDKYSLVLITFAIAQITIAIFQFAFDTSSSEHPWRGLFMLASCAVIIYFIFRAFDKIIK